MQPAKGIDAYTVIALEALHFWLIDEETKKIIQRSCRYERQQPQSVMDESKGTCPHSSDRNWDTFERIVTLFFPFSCENRCCGTNIRVFERLLEKGTYRFYFKCIAGPIILWDESLVFLNCNKHFSSCTHVKTSLASFRVFVWWNRGCTVRLFWKQVHSL